MHHIDIKNIIPESVSPHLKIKEVMLKEMFHL
jgi:hypothetical protein